MGPAVRAGIRDLHAGMPAARSGTSAARSGSDRIARRQRAPRPPCHRLRRSSRVRRRAGCRQGRGRRSQERPAGRRTRRRSRAAGARFSAKDATPLRRRRRVGRRHRLRERPKDRCRGRPAGRRQPAFFAPTGQLFAGYGSGLVALDPNTIAIVQRIALPGHPEAFELAERGPEIYVNVPSAGLFVVVDRRTFVAASSRSASESRLLPPLEAV